MSDAEQAGLKLVLGWKDGRMDGRELLVACFVWW